MRALVLFSPLMFESGYVLVYHVHSTMPYAALHEYIFPLIISFATNTFHFANNIKTTMITAITEGEHISTGAQK